MSLAEYARASILGRRLPAAGTRDNAALLVELNRIGLDLREFNRVSGQGCDPGAVETVFTKLEATLDKVAGDGP